MSEAVTAFLNAPAGQALAAMLVVAFLDFATGVFAALRDGTFSLDAIAAFLRKHIWGRVGPLAMLLVVAYFGGDSTIGTLFGAGAIAGAAAYVAETAASVWGNINPPKPSAVETATNPATITNPVPTE